MGSRYRVYVSTPDDSGYLSRIRETLQTSPRGGSTWSDSGAAVRHVKGRYQGVVMVAPGTEPERNQTIAWVEEV